MEKRPVPFGSELHELDHWVDCSCLERRKIKRLFAFSDITDEAKARMTFERFNLDGKAESVVDAFHSAQEYLRRFERIRKKVANGIFFGGAPGSGKTHLLMSISSRLIDAGVPLVYFPFVEGLEELKSTIKSANNDYQEKLRKLQTVDVLFIDDLLKRKKGTDVTDYEFKFIFNVINYRYLNHLPTLVSSELTLKELVFWDDGIGSRITQMTADYQVFIGKEEGINHRIPREG